jgi:hypothetical protein
MLRQLGTEEDLLAWKSQVDVVIYSHASNWC